MKLWRHGQDPTRNEQSWFWSKSGRFFAYLLIVLGTFLTFILANFASNVVQVICVGILDKNNGIMSGNGIQTTFNFMLNALNNWQSWIYNDELLNSIYLGGSQFFQNHGTTLASLLKWSLFAFLFWHYNVYYMLHLYNRSSKLNHGQQGDDRLALPKEIGQETFKIPDRHYDYNLPSGLLTMHKMNLRGRINMFVKQQRAPTQKALQLRKDENDGFRIIENTIVAILFFLILLGTLLDAGKPTDALPIYSPIRLWRGIGDAFSFVFHNIPSSWKWLFKSEQDILQQTPLYVSSPIILLEIIGMGYVIVHLYNHFTHANMRDIKNSPLNLRGRWKHFKNCFRPSNIYLHFKHWLLSFRKDAHNGAQIDTSDYDNSQESLQPSSDDTQVGSSVPSSRLKHGAYSLVNNDADQAMKVTTSSDESPDTMPDVPTYVHSKKNPVIRALYKMGMHPFKSSEYMLLNTLNLLPLDKGITGYYYVNAKLMNVLIWGTTRSGKGQQMINTTIESNSRTKKQKKNLLINDSKGELSAGFYQTLKKRGYRVEVLNIIQMLHSMSYNPLELVKRHAMQGDIGQAAKACSDLSYTIYQSSQSAHGQNAYFYNSAANVFDASVFALLALANSDVYGRDDKYLNISDRHDPNAFDKITIANVVQLTTQLGGSQSNEVGTSGSQTSSNQLIIFFKHLGEQTQSLRDLRDERKQHNPEKYDETDINPLTNIENDQLNLLDQALQKFNQSKMAGDEASGSIYSTFIEGLRIYQQPDVAKMTSMNSVNIQELGFDRLLTVQLNRAFNQQELFIEVIAPIPQGKGKVDYRVLERDTSHLSTIGLAQIPIRHSIPYGHFYLRLTIRDERIAADQDKNKFQWLVDCHKTYYNYDEVARLKQDPRRSPQVADIDLNKDQHTALDHYTHQSVFKKIAMKVKSAPSKKRFTEEKIGKSVLNSLASDQEESLRTSQLRFLYREQPTALFLVTPPDQQELNQLCTFLINQTFNTLYSLASTITDSRKVQRPLQMILDEVGNIPAIPKLDTKASIGLSAGVEMMLVFQDRKQIDKIYQKDVAGIVIANCATIIYILSHDEGTVKEVSNSFGNRTIKSSQLTVNPNSLNGTSKNYNLQKQDVMPVGRLRHLKIGEMAIIRTTDRSDVWGKNVRPNPVFNTYWGHQNFLMPYAFWFLGDEIKSDVSLSTIPVVTPHKYLDLNDLTVNFSSIYTQMEIADTMDNSNFHRVLVKVREELDQSVHDPNSENHIDQEITNAQNDKNLGKLYQLRNQYVNNDKSAGKVARYFNQIATMIDTMGSEKKVIQVLHNFSANSRVDLMDLRSLSEAVFWHFDIKKIDYSSLTPANVKELLGVIDTIEHFHPQETDNNETTYHLVMETIRKIKDCFNDYFVNVGIIDENEDNGEYQLSSRGRDFIEHANEYIGVYDKHVVADPENRIKIQDYVLHVIDVLKSFYDTEYSDKRMTMDKLTTLREWVGLFVFQEFVHSNELKKFLTDERGNYDSQISTLPLLQNILGILDNMFLCYQVKDDPQAEQKCIRTRKSSDSLSDLMHDLLRTEQFFQNMGTK